jgi:hypothetical protein
MFQVRPELHMRAYLRDLRFPADAINVAAIESVRHPEEWQVGWEFLPHSVETHRRQLRAVYG